MTSITAAVNNKTEALLRFMPNHQGREDLIEAHKPTGRMLQDCPRTFQPLALSPCRERKAMPLEIGPASRGIIGHICVIRIIRRKV
jgi:hypothetical protein